MDIKTEYFGTNLQSHGHFFWLLEGENILRSKTKFNEIPFSPEEVRKLPFQVFPAYDPNRGRDVKGDVTFYHVAGAGTDIYSVLHICGSPVDTRGNSHSVFWVKVRLEYDEMISHLKMIPAFQNIITKMPFDVRL